MERSDEHGFTIHDFESPLLIPAWAVSRGFETWYALPAWRLSFDVGPLAARDLRMHKSLNASQSWVIADSETGFVVYQGDEDQGMRDTVESFCATLRKKITPERLTDAIDKANARLRDFLPRPESTIRFKA